LPTCFRQGYRRENRDSEGEVGYPAEPGNTAPQRF
jgi:hypothetical protein